MKWKRQKTPNHLPQYILYKAEEEKMRLILSLHFPKSKFQLI